MSKTRELEDELLGGRYEYRVWGKHRKARKLLARHATEEIHEQIDDCYFLVDDQALNAKVRDSTLKVKQLVGMERGFEVWTSDWHLAAKTAPAPFDELFATLRLDRPARGKSFDLEKAVAELSEDSGTRAVFVTKHRRRYRLGSIRAEVTDVEIHGTKETLRTLAIEGDDLTELVAWRKRLGMRDSPNRAMHVALDED